MTEWTLVSMIDCFNCPLMHQSCLRHAVLVRNAIFAMLFKENNYF